MPAAFPEMWESRVRALLQDEQLAPWLDGIPEIDTQVLEVGSGSASESNIIHIPITTFRPGVLINNTTYPIALVAYDDTSMTVQLDKYQTKVTTLTDDQANGSSYKQIDTITKSHRDDITESKFAKAIHSIAPQAAVANKTFVIQCTGDEVTVGGRRKMLWKDLVAARKAMNDAKCKKRGRRIVLCDDHVTDLLEDNSNKYADKLADYLAGTIKGVLAGFEVYENVDNPMYTAAGVKKAWGAVPGGTDRNASVIFHPENIVKKTGLTKQYFADAKSAPQTQQNEYAIRHYFIAVPVMDRYSGVII
ncbi:phage major capsid protein [Flavobacterium psychrophilum]|uniref:phage major capsid protein n=2 Tax=Flavobacterium psychrophilum TaxID=96345 RepID=UPI000B7C1A12|nr:hypothetical protein [Flavobacterium psychrophilum]SNA88035.1 conserved hypothetical protein [Flavobacterium psychrophilum]SNB14265.1 conserved hypothetical protein [Flavobacterium psychrophilum]